MANGIMLALGDFRFEVSTAAYQRLRRQHGWKWAEQDRLARKPALQYTGPELVEIELEGVIYPHFAGGLGQIDAMRAEADKAEPLDLVDGNGQVWGLYAILEVEEEQTVFLANGAPKRMDFRLKLKEFGDDAPGSG